MFNLKMIDMPKEIKNGHTCIILYPELSFLLCQQKMATNVCDKIYNFISRSQAFLFTYLIFLYQGDKGHLLQKYI